MSVKWLNGLDLEQTRAGVQQESRARILLLGLAGAGKSSLLNRLCGWTVSTPRAPGTNGPNTTGPWTEAIEDFGLFCLVDLPADTAGSSSLGSLMLAQPEAYLYGAAPNGLGLNADLDGTMGLGMPGDPLVMAETANLLVYILDGAVGVQPADYRWVGRLRRLGVPLLVVLNKRDLFEAELPTRQAEIEARLGTSVVLVSAETGSEGTDPLLSQMISLCPELTVALGRELRSFRGQAARRLIRQAAFINGLVALEPVPLLDLPVQIITLSGLMLRLAALYDRPPSKARRREVVIAIGSGLAGRLAAQQVAKLVPVVGWLVSSLIGWSSTWGLGQAAVAFFEAGGDAAVDQRWNRTRHRLSEIVRKVYGRWQHRPRLRVAIERSGSGEEAGHTQLEPKAVIEVPPEPEEKVSDSQQE